MVVRGADVGIVHTGPTTLSGDSGRRDGAVPARRISIGTADQLSR